MGQPSDQALREASGAIRSGMPLVQCWPRMPANSAAMETFLASSKGLRCFKSMVD